MKKVGKCNECERTLYTNDFELCKRCFNEVGVEAINSMEDIEEEDPLAAASEVLEGNESTEESAEEAAEPKEESAEEPEAKE
ncbi:hypothetical protein GF336_06355 [Candidatus Woesearchaeota archaeon]|nr:hypothetical protein [Candidatus Woesearchaeota archaeon]